jgi:hypothetical protein
MQRRELNKRPFYGLRAGLTAAEGRGSFYAIFIFPQVFYTVFLHDRAYISAS